MSMFWPQAIHHAHLARPLADRLEQGFGPGPLLLLLLLELGLELPLRLVVVRGAQQG